MDKTNLIKTFLTTAVAGGIALSANAQVIFQDDFQSYSDSAAVLQTWNPVGTNPGLSLVDDSGNSYASVSRTAANNVFTWAGNSNPNLVPEEFRTETGWSYTPTDERPLVFTVSIYDPGTGGLANNTAGIRTDANPLFEMGLYNGDFNSYVVRTIGMHTPAGYRYFLSGGTSADNIRVEGWHTFQATFTSTTTTVTLDLGSNGTVDYTLSYAGDPIGAFTDLRIGGPQGAANGGAAMGYDNIKLEVIPEPSTYAAIFGGLALVGAFVYRRRMSAKK